MNQTILKLVEQNPNDAVLGAAVRALYWKHVNNQTTFDPNQITLDQMIADVNNS